MPIFHEHQQSTSSASSHSPTSPHDPHTCCDHSRMRSDKHSPSAMDSFPSDFPSATRHDVAPSRPLSRGEIISRIKRGESPTWTFCHCQNRSRTSPARDGHTSITPRQSPRPGLSPTTSPKPAAALLPALELRRIVSRTRDDLPERTGSADPEQDGNLVIGLAIERPPSALHSGDFRHSPRGQEDAGPPAPDTRPSTARPTSPIVPWHPDASFRHTPRPRSSLPRARALSHSFSYSSVAFVPPTSPLAQTVSSDSDRENPGRRAPDKENRRHTFSPAAFASWRHPGPLSFPATTPPRPRRPSASLDHSPLHHAPLVGSYEESILRGRMSTIPSRPLNFLAQIGVLARGKCRPSLRCPPHVTVPFPAVFYSYPGISDQP
ncbi:hypothetical protein EJ06DRAFT_528900, partial [Trichodelitschia bisporula]